MFVTRAGTPYRLDKLRHTYASVMAMAAGRVSVEVLSKRLGHKDANVTRGIHRHVYDGEGLTFDPLTLALSLNPASGGG